MIIMDVNDDKFESVPCILFCGNLAEEWHHIAGISNGVFMVPLCKKCHLMLTNLMRAAGIDLSHVKKPFRVKLEGILIGVGIFLVALSSALIKVVVAQWTPA